MSTSFVKIGLIGFCAVCFGLSLNAATQNQDNENWFVRTKAIEDLYVRVFSTHDTDTTNNTSVDSKLAFCVWEANTNKNNEVTVYMPTTLEYVYQVELLDTNGAALPKKKLAEKIGVKFLDLKPSFTNDTGFELTRVHITPSLGGPYLFFPHKPGYYNGEPFYSPNDLFEIKQSGNYTLRIQFQFIVATNSNIHKTAHVVRFPPLDYPLVKVAAPAKSPPK
jgi:hypothetical protein